MYKTRPRTLDELENRIREVLNAVPPDFVRKSMDNAPIRLQKCIDNADAYVEF